MHNESMNAATTPVQIFRTGSILAAGNRSDLITWVEQILVRGPSHIVIDGRELKFLDIAGVGALASALARVRRASSQLSLYNMPFQAQMVLQMADIHHLFDSYTGALSEPEDG
jgi:anti-anti-sigma factor